jgi:hypothetical protein
MNPGRPELISGPTPVTRSNIICFQIKSMFNPEGPKIEIEKTQDSEKDAGLELKITDAQLRVYDLYEQNLLTENEAIAFLKNLSHVNNSEEFRDFEEKIFIHPAVVVERSNKECEEFIRVKEIKQNMEQAINTLDMNNWDKNFIETINQISDFEGENYNENILKALLAKYLEKTYNIYRENNKNADDFGEVLEGLIRNEKFTMPKFLTISKYDSLDRRQPSFQESTKETVERLRKIENLAEYLKGDVEGVIIGGSMSYGLFYNIRGGLDATGSSDIDIIAILKEKEFEKEDYLNDVKNIDFFTNEEKMKFLKRKQVFSKLKENGTADIFTQKFHVMDKNFNISIHFFPKNAFNDMIGKKLERERVRR